MSARAVAVALAIALVVPSPARAGEPERQPERQAERPWAAGVSAEQQKQAFAIFDAGNALFAEGQHAAALAKYREALKAWDHPAIRYNAAVALINLDQPLPAYENLEASLQYGAAPLGDDTYKQALLYKKLLLGQLAELAVACDEPGADVMLDGELLFRAPGKATRHLLPGAHSLVARKAGMLTETRALQLPSGKLSTETMKLTALGALPSRTVRRWAWWKPWVVFGAGALVALIGVPLIVDAKSNLDAFDSEIARLCPSGCTAAQLPATVLAARSRATAENGAAVGMFAVGGAGLAAGVVLLILNQPHLEAARPVALAPIVGPGSVGLSASLKF